MALPLLALARAAAIGGRWQTCLLAGWIAATLPVAMAAAEMGDEPYLAEVAVAEAEIRCGPGEEYYGTTILRSGSQVEVYRRGPDGWLGIRPPAGSFSWVESRYVKRAADPELGEIRGLRVVSWIGSDQESIGDHRWLVRFKPGEVVEILGERSLIIHGSASQTLFYQISPPAGEFRWIRGSDVRPIHAPAGGIADESSGSNVELADFEVGAAPSDEESPWRDRRIARHEGSARQADSAGPSPDVLLGDAPERLSDREFVRRVKEVDLELALAVTHEPRQWKLASLRRRLETLAARAASTVQRAHAEVVLDRLAEFEDLRKRYHGLSDDPQNAVQPEEADRLPSDASESVTGRAEDGARRANPPAVDPRFDGRGWLLPVHSRKRESPPYALLDADGKILQFVSPAPGLNLNRYVRKEVGVYGQRSYLPNFEKDHVTAARVVSLDRHRR